MTPFLTPTMAVEKRMKRARYMVWGGVGAGKTTLVNALNSNNSAVARKTQMIDYRGLAIDTPGEYVELGHLRRHLQAAASEVRLFLVVVDATRSETRFPPHYFLMFPQTVIGIVNKIDLASAAEVEQATRLLRQIGVMGEIFFVSAINGSGLDKVRQILLTHLQ